MKEYTAHFTGKRLGAIGVFETFDVIVKANNMNEARLKLYDDYEHILDCLILPKSTKLKKQATP